jgi:pilus assembly protein CpaE
MNRSDSRSSDLDEAMVSKALTRKVEWRIPSDYATVRKYQNEATPLVLADSPVSRVINRMVRKAAGLPDEPEKKKRFSLFR